MKSYFVTACGTNVGKTLITCALAHQLAGTQALKPVISGFDPQHPEISDTGQLIKAQKLAITPETIESVSPWRFAASISPDAAATLEGRAIDFDRLVAFCNQKRQAQTLLIEGVGGVMAPLTQKYTVLDWTQALGLPVILVAGSYLGALNHTLLSARALLSAGLSLHAVVISASDTDAEALSRAQGTLRRFLPENTRFATVARLDSRDDLWKYVPDLTHTLAL